MNEIKKIEELLKGARWRFRFDLKRFSLHKGTFFIGYLYYVEDRDYWLFDLGETFVNQYCNFEMAKSNGLVKIFSRFLGFYVAIQCGYKFPGDDRWGEVLPNRMRMHPRPKRS